MSKRVNIGGKKDDIFYRYKRPIITAKVEKPGTNGVKTVIENMTAIATALNVPPEYPTKFFGYELGSQASYMVSPDRTCTIVKGSHTVESLERVLEDFIKIFVLCPKCELPEIRLSVNKAQVRVSCNACGCECGLTKSHRLENFILKNPPKSRVKETVDEKLTEELSQQEWISDASLEAQKQRRKEFLSGTVKDRDKMKSEKKKSIEPQQPDQIFKTFVESNPSEDAITSELDRLRVAHSMSLEERNRVLLLGLIDSSLERTFGAQFAKHARVLQRYVTDKTSGVLMIGSIEQFLSGNNISDQKEHRPKVVKGLSKIERIPVILDKLYETSVLSEEVILSWWNSPPEASSWAVPTEEASLARKYAQPFVEWLQTTEEE